MTDDELLKLYWDHMGFFNFDKSSLETKEGIRDSLGFQAFKLGLAIDNLKHTIKAGIKKDVYRISQKLKNSFKP